MPYGPAYKARSDLDRAVRRIDELENVVNALRSRMLEIDPSTGSLPDHDDPDEADLGPDRDDDDELPPSAFIA